MIVGSAHPSPTPLLKKWSDAEPIYIQYKFVHRMETLSGSAGVATPVERIRQPQLLTMIELRLFGAGVQSRLSQEVIQIVSLNSSNISSMARLNMNT